MGVVGICATEEPGSLARCLETHGKVGSFRKADSVGETPTEATETVALPMKSRIIGTKSEVVRQRGIVYPDGQE
jgi:hypothetical protein